MSVATRTTVRTPLREPLSCPVCGIFISKDMSHSHSWDENPVRKQEELELEQSLNKRSPFWFESTGFE